MEIVGTVVHFWLHMPSSCEGSICSLPVPRDGAAPRSPCGTISSAEEIGPALGSLAPSSASIAGSVGSTATSLASVTAPKSDDDASEASDFIERSGARSSIGSDSDIDTCDLPDVGGNTKTAPAAIGKDIIYTGAEVAEAEVQENAERMSTP